MVNNTPEIMTIGETAQYLRISLSSLYKLAQEGRIPCQKVGRHWRFRREAIDRWLEQSKPPLHSKLATDNQDIENEKGVSS
jgi:excisionase family DNA binding protein